MWDALMFTVTVTPWQSEGQCVGCHVYCDMDTVAVGGSVCGMPCLLSHTGTLWQSEDQCVGCHVYCHRDTVAV